MPWARNSDLPSSVKSALPADAQTRFREVANDRMYAGSSEESAIKQAWHVVKQGWEKDDSGEWVRKHASHDQKTHGNWADGGGGGGGKGAGISDDQAEKVASSLISGIKRDSFLGGRNVQSDADYGNDKWSREADGSIMVGLRDVGKWENPPDAEPDEDDYDWKVPTRETRTKVKAFAEAFERTNKVKVQVSAGEKNWTYFHIKPAGGAKAKKRDDDFTKAEVAKVDEALGLVFGWAIVSKVDGEDYYDSQGDHIPEDSMLKAGADFMLRSRVAKDMHRGDQIGDVVFAFPLTEDVAKAMDIDTRKTGLMVAMRPSAGVLGKFRSGEYTGFSIGGTRVKDDHV